MFKQVYLYAADGRPVLETVLRLPFPPTVQWQGGEYAWNTAKDGYVEVTAPAPVPTLPPTPAK